jgi:predicted ATPase
MYIKSLSYEDQSTDWKLEKIEFKPLTLLVGVSGVGKTRILKALLNLKEISLGNSITGLKWEIEFKTSAGHDCKWSGAFKSLGLLSSGREHFKHIDNERLHIDNELVIERDSVDIVFNGKQTVKLSQQESVISLLKEEPQIKDINENFKEIIFHDNAGSSPKAGDFVNEKMESKLDRYKNLNTIRNSNENLTTKLYLLYKNQEGLFKKIVDDFIDIFRYVEDMKVDTFSFDDVSEYVFIEIKEKNVSRWISGHQMSSGMLRTLMQIAELHLCADDSVILIDEFENSLGINCIDDLTSSIVSSERNLQFIVTSHHPYIINKIDTAHWKLVTRNGGVVTATDAESFGISKSKHQAFTQLINLDAYTDGVAS